MQKQLMQGDNFKQIVDSLSSVFYFTSNNSKFYDLSFKASINKEIQFLNCGVL